MGTIAWLPAIVAWWRTWRAWLAAPPESPWVTALKSETAAAIDDFWLALNRRALTTPVDLSFPAQFARYQDIATAEQERTGQPGYLARYDPTRND